MDENSPDRRDSRQSGSTSCSDRILDRKIERHGLTQSFSSNLARKGPSSDRKASDRSVRDMVSLFEKSTDTPDKPPPGRPSLARERITVGDKRGDRRRDRDIDHSKTAWQRQHQAEQGQLDSSKISTPAMRPSVQIGYQVEDYSLTLLRHKSYFNNRPLARCLDENHEKDKQTKIQRVQSRKENSRRPLPRRHRDNDDKKENRALVPSGRNRTSSPIQQLDSLMGELLTWQGISGSGTPEPDQHQKERDRNETDDYWRSVRTQLWVDEDEIYGERLKKLAQESPILDKGSEQIAVKPPAIASVLPACYNSGPEPEEPPPPVPTRPPPPVPAAHRGRSISATSSQPRQHSIAALELFPEAADDYPTWDERPSTSSVRLSISAPGCLDISDVLPGECPEIALPALPEPGRPLPIPPMEPRHSRYPSSSSGHWVRPPTWRSPSSLQPSSPPPVPPLPVPLPAPPPPTTARQHRSNHSRHRRPPHISSASTSISTHSVAATDSSGKSLHSRRMPKTSISSVTTRSTRADSGADLSAAYQPRPPRRRLTTEEKLSEIDAFLSPEREGEERWI